MARPRIARALLVAAALFLAFVAGAAFVFFDPVPGDPLTNAFRGLRALRIRWEVGRMDPNPFLWPLKHHALRGVKVNDRARANPGLTLFSTGAGSNAYLMNNDGVILHTWQMPYHQVHDDSSAVRDPVPERAIHFRSVRALPGGDIVAVYEGMGDTPYGYGLIRLDWDSNVVWKNLGHFHHAFDFTPDGGLVALSQELATRPFRDTIVPVPFLDDRVVFLDRNGVVQREIPILAALRDSPYEKLTTRPSDQFYERDDGDYLHANDVEFITDAKARNFPFGRPGDVLVSLRSQGLLLVIDPDAGSVRWARRGSWVMQHDPDLLPNGHILLFDNLGDLATGGSRVIEYDPVTEAIVWEFKSSGGRFFHSYGRSGQQLLANGDILISESETAHILEVNRDRQIVWDYFLEERSPDGRFPILCDARKYPRDWFPLAADER